MPAMPDGAAPETRSSRIRVLRGEQAGLSTRWLHGFATPALNHIHIRLIDVGQKARVQINRDHSSIVTDCLREPSRYGATSCTDLTASPTFTNPKLQNRAPRSVVEELF